MKEQGSKLKECKNKFKLFYHDTVEIRPNNKEHRKDLEKGVVLDTSLELYNKLLNICRLNMINLQKLRRKG